MSWNNSDTSFLWWRLKLYFILLYIILFSVVHSLSHIRRLFVTPRTVSRQASLSLTNSWRLLKVMSIESVMPSNHLVLCHHRLLLLPSIFPSIRVFPSESALHIRWPKYWSFSFSISPSDESSGLISFSLILLHFQKYLFICLATPGHSCGTQDLLVAVCELLLATCRI